MKGQWYEAHTRHWTTHSDGPVRHAVGRWLPRASRTGEELPRCVWCHKCAKAISS